MNIDPNSIRSISVLGCGGTGGHVAAALARLEIAVNSLGGKFPRVSLCDPDIVEPPNIGRQLFSHDDVGVNKATALAERINLSYGMDWRASDKDTHGDLNLVCVDSRRVRKRTYKEVKGRFNGGHFQHCYYLDCGNDASTGQVILGGGELPLPNKRFPSLTDLRFKDPGPSCSLAEALESQELFINQHIATLGMQLVWSIFRYGRIKCAGYFSDLNATTQPIPLGQSC